MGCGIRGVLDAWVLDAWSAGCVGCWMRGVLDAWGAGSVGCWMRGVLDAWGAGCVERLMKSVLLDTKYYKYLHFIVIHIKILYSYVSDIYTDICASYHCIYPFSQYTRIQCETFQLFYDNRSRFDSTFSIELLMINSQR